MVPQMRKLARWGGRLPAVLAGRWLGSGDGLVGGIIGGIGMKASQNSKQSHEH